MLACQGGYSDCRQREALLQAGSGVDWVEYPAPWGENKSDAPLLAVGYFTNAAVSVQPPGLWVDRALYLSYYIYNR